MRRTRFHRLLLSLGLGLCGGPAMSGSSGWAAQDALPDLIHEALQNNPGLKAMRYQVDGLHSSLDHTWFLEAPEIGVEFYQTPISSFPNPIKNQMEMDYSIKQGFPFPGKIAARVKAEHSKAQMGETNLEGRKRKVIREVKTQYYELYLIQRQLEINRENQTLMNRLIEIARRQYEVGMGRQSDILRAQTEATNLAADSISLMQQKQSMEAMLNANLNRTIAGPIAVSATLTPAEINWTLNQLRPVLKKSHPGLQNMAAGIRMREAEKTMVRKDLLPDIMLGGMYKDMLEPAPGAMSSKVEDYWSVMASVSIPFALWTLPKYRSQDAQSNAYLNQARQEYIDEENMAYGRAQGALLKAQSSRELLRLSREILLPQAQQALESNLAAYQGGKGEFMGLIDSYRMRLMAKLNTEMSLMQLMVSQAELEEAVGLDLEEIAHEISGGNGK